MFYFYNGGSTHVYLLSFSLSLSLFVCLFVCLSVFLFVCLFVCQSVFLYVYLVGKGSKWVFFKMTWSCLLTYSFFKSHKKLVLFWIPKWGMFQQDRLCMSVCLS